MKQNVTNQSVGDALNIDQSYVSLIRRGLRVPKREIISHMARVYQCDGRELMAAYMDPDPLVFARYFCEVTGLPAPTQPDATEEEASA